MGTNDINDPMRGERSNAEDDEERDEVVLLLAEPFRPCVETSLPFGNGEEGGAKGGTDEIAKSSASSDASTGKGYGDGYTPYCTTEDGEIHGAGERESL